MMGSVRDVAAAIEGRERFLLSLHRSPDGDSVGSTLAMGLVLSGRGGSVTMVTTDPVPRAYRFLPGTDRFEDPDTVSGPWDAAVIIDCGSLDRTGRARGLVEACPVVVNIDHHETNTGFGHVNWVDADRASAGQMILELMEVMGLEPDTEQALALYTAISTDTGFFTYPSTTAAVLRVAAGLVDRGADPGLVSANVNESRSPASLRILGVALGSVVVDDGVAWMSLSRSDLESTDASPEDINGIVNYARSLHGIEVGILFVEQESGQVKVSLRSREADVARVAETLGGGGHPRAAGCIVRGPLADAVERVVDLAREAARSAS